MRVCVEKECVQRCSVFTSGVCTRNMCEGVCVTRGCFQGVCEGVCEGVCV